MTNLDELLAFGGVPTLPQPNGYHKRCGHILVAIGP